MLFPSPKLPSCLLMTILLASTTRTIRITSIDTCLFWCFIEREFSRRGGYRAVRDDSYHFRTPHDQPGA